ncbi:L-alanine exporter AlaE [Patescibacteria group bacterium]
MKEIGKVMFGNLKNLFQITRQKNFKQDTLSMLFFFTAAIILEASSGASFKEIAKAKLIFLPKPFILGGLYGKYRDWVFYELLEISREDKLSRGFFEIFTLLSYKGPFYLVCLYFAGFSWDEIRFTVKGAITAVFFFGWAYTFLLEFIRQFSSFKDFYEWLRELPERIYQSLQNLSPKIPKWIHYVIAFGWISLALKRKTPH